MTTKKNIKYSTAISIVVANMIGTGVFTSLGFQLFDIHSGFALLCLWVVGGIAALLGSLCYSEIGAALPRSGGEYHYLSRIYHPAVGFLSGWVSGTVGFSAPVAAAAMALGGYTNRVFPSLSGIFIAIVVIILLTFIHSWDVKKGGVFQNFFTFLKVVFIVFIIIAGFLSGRTGDTSFMPTPASWDEITSAGFAVSLYWVSYSYSGWNASSYIAGEMDNPQKNIPRSLFRGTLFVMALYILLNAVFLYTTPAAEMTGQKEVGYVAANHIFGSTGGSIIGGIIALLLVSSISSMIIAGPRVTQVMGEDIPLLSFFAKKNNEGSPYVAIITQSALSMLFVLTSSFDQVITYIGFTLSLFLFMTVLGLYVLRIKDPGLHRPYKTWGYPITPALFLIITGWIIYYGFMEKPVESLAGLATVLLGLIIYFINKSRNKTSKEGTNVLS